MAGKLAVITITNIVNSNGKKEVFGNETIYLVPYNHHCLPARRE